MRNVLRILFIVGVSVGLAGFASGADQTWTGKISDSMCGASHAKMIAAHGGTDRDCTLACTKAGGKFVFVVGTKVYKIANQDDADLQTHAGHIVRLTGDVKGDTITVSRIVMPGAKKS